MKEPRVYGYNIPQVFDQSERKQYIVSYFLCELGYQLVLDSDDKITVDSLVTKCENCVSQDILENEDVKLDHMFMASLIADIVKVLLSCLLIIITLF